MITVALEADDAVVVVEPGTRPGAAPGGRGGRRRLRREQERGRGRLLLQWRLQVRLPEEAPLLRRRLERAALRRREGRRGRLRLRLGREPGGLLQVLPQKDRQVARRGRRGRARGGGARADRPVRRWRPAGVGVRGKGCRKGPACRGSRGGRADRAS